MRKIYLLFLIFASVILLGFVVYLFINKNMPPKAITADSSITINTDADWAAGTLISIDTSTSGSIKQDLSDQIISLIGKSSTDSNANDDNTSTKWIGATGPAATGSWVVDLSEAQQETKFNVHYSADNYCMVCEPSITISGSNNNTDFTSLGLLNIISGPFCNVEHSCVELTATGNYRYLKISIVNTSNSDPTGDFGLRDSDRTYINEMYVYGKPIGIHTTGSTQIDGGESFWSWDSNTITQTVPANTSATYQYRTSANGTDWTAWVGSIGSVTSRAGDDSNNPTRYRYLQIKATLSNTDGASTPTIDSYGINYHTEIKPTAPSAQTAVTQ